MKISELFETTADGSDSITYKPVKVDDYEYAVNLIKKHASDAMWMLEKDRPIYRGSSSARIISDIAIADPSKTKRISSNTENYYTLILDNHPEMKDFPKRSRSFIGTTARERGKAYAYSDKNLYALIPFNGTKIGIVGYDDIWELEINIFGETIKINKLNTLFSRLGIRTLDINDLKEYAKKLKNDEQEIKKFFTVFDIWSWPSRPDTIDEAKNFAKNFMDHIWKAYSPTQTGLKWETTATMNKALVNEEVWVGGKCLVIKNNYWERLVHYYKNQYYESK